MALDTATDRLSVAVGTLYANARQANARQANARQANARQANAFGADAVEEDVPGARRHAGALVPVLDRLLARRGIGVAELAGVVVSDGPGSFTGLRVGASVAKALARARGLPVRSAPSLMVRAAGVVPSSELAPAGAIVLALSNALRGEVYAAAYRIAPGRIETLVAPSVFRPEVLVSVAPRPDQVVGDGPPAALELVAAWADRPVIGAPAGLPRAVVLLGLVGIEGGAQVVADVERWEPVYGRPAEAQAKWELAHGRRLADQAGGAR